MLWNIYPNTGMYSLVFLEDTDTSYILLIAAKRVFIGINS